MTPSGIVLPVLPNQTYGPLDVLNPFEIWAYRRDERWEVNGAQPVLKWGSFRWPVEDDR